MEYKRYLNIFNSQSDYESQKDKVMDMPHVVLLEDTNEVIFASKNKEIDYSSQPFTLVALENGTMDIAMPSGATFINYSLNDGDWVENTEDIALEVKVNDKVKLKANAEGVMGYDYKIFDLSIPFNAEGNIMSLLYGDDFKDKTTIEYESCFYNCFYETKIVSAKNLILPATTLAYYCYSNMFYNCTSLVEAPQLPATTLASNCYSSMFASCTNLTTAPQLPATTLASNCYSSMFANCTSLTEAPELPATTLADNCYYNMFRDCTSLTEAPQLPATTLTGYCYSNMFEGCTSLTKAPELPATTLANNCYYYMFYGCISLKEVLELPATTLASDCYSNMFNGCTSLIEAPELPATTLKYNCYACMFYGCTSLTTAPELLAKTLSLGCYTNMFNGCNSLTKITMLATDISASYCLDNWVWNVASSGTFVKNAAMTSLPSGTSGIPNGWTVENA